MITLQVPEGDKCKGCMFLRVSYVPERAKCALFGEDLSARYQYGSMDEDTIAKCDQCPTANGERDDRFTARPRAVKRICPRSCSALRVTGAEVSTGVGVGSSTRL